MLGTVIDDEEFTSQVVRMLEDDFTHARPMLAEEYRDHPLITPSVAAHSPYSVCAANLVKEAELAEDLGVPMQIHLSETRWEVDKLIANIRHPSMTSKKQRAT